MNKNLYKNMGVFLVTLLKLGQSEKGSSGLQQEIRVLSAGDKAAVKNYYVKKVSAFLFILSVGILLAGIVYIQQRMDHKEVYMNSISRPGYGESNRTQELTVSIDGQEETMAVDISARAYTDAQKKKWLKLAKEELEGLILGENTSFDRVQKNLVFPQTLQGGIVSVSWSTRPYQVIDNDGTVHGSDPEGISVEIEATLQCDNIGLPYQQTVRVYPVELSDGEQLRQQIRQAVQEANEKDLTEESITLPKDVQGSRILWKMPESSAVGYVIMLALLAAVGIWAEMDAQIHKKAKERKDQLVLDYPDLMWKMTMLISAGLSLKGTFQRIAAEYRQKKETASSKKKKELRYVYEEVLYTCYEMQSGIPEAEAYERFGRRCEHTEYIRLGSILSQNLKKGSSGLVDLLAMEAENSLNDRKSHARTIAEQAGTKMLMPMMLMLGIVMVVLVVPAFLGM